MRYQNQLLFLGSLLFTLGFVQPTGGFLMIWLGANLIMVSFAYRYRWHFVFGKRIDGTLPIWSWFVFWPFLTYTLIVWHLWRSLTREPAQNRINQALVIGRRLLPSELSANFDHYIDLTAEFQAPLVIRQSPAYRSFPILDGSVPSPELLQQFVASLRPGQMFIHCAQGHGRTGLVALAILLYHGEVSSVKEGLQKLMICRPRIGLNQEQLTCIRQFYSLVIESKPTREE